MEYDILIQKANEVYDCDLSEKTRKHKHVWAGTAVAIELVKDFTHQMTGEYLGVDHSTITNRLRRHEEHYGRCKSYTILYNRFCVAIGKPVTKTVEARKVEQGKPKNQLLVDMVSTIPDHLVDYIATRLEPIIYMSKVVHKLK